MPVRAVFVDDWRLVRRIGEGDQGKSTLMERKRDGELAVRKQINHYETTNGGPLEAIILQDILPSSRRLVELKAFTFEPSGRADPYLIEWFEYCQGGDLQHAVPQSGRLPEDFIWHCFIQIAEALDVLHNVGSREVVHRDIKPDNIFLDQKYRYAAPWPNLKVGDFGMATIEPHTEGVFVPCWQGPELPLLSTAGDIWGLGAIIHWLAHGRPPIRSRSANFRGSQKEWEVRPEARKPMPLPRPYSSNLNDHMMRCLEWDPRDRISSEKLVDRLERDRPRSRSRPHH